MSRKSWERLYSTSPERRYRFIKRRHPNSNLTFEEYKPMILNSSCYYCGGNLDPCGVGLDRIDNSMGYDFGNILPCCGSCNKLKSDHLTTKETSLLVNLLMKERKDEQEYNARFPRIYTREFRNTNPCFEKFNLRYVFQPESQSNPSTKCYGWNNSSGGKLRSSREEAE